MAYALYLGNGDLAPTGEFFGELFLDFELPEAETLEEAELLVAQRAARLPSDCADFLVLAFDVDDTGLVATYAVVPKPVRAVKVLQR